MRYHPTTLGEARLVARTLDFETKHGDLGVNRCPNCHEATFALGCNPNIPSKSAQQLPGALFLCGYTGTNKGLSKNAPTNSPVAHNVC